MCKVFLVFFFAAVNTGLFAVDVPVRISSENKWIIIDKAVTKQPTLSVSIREINGNVLVRENIKKPTKYNLKYVPDGEYVIQLEDNQRITTQTISIEDGLILNKESSVVFKPYFIYNAGILDMNLMAQGVPATVTIRDRSGEIILEENITNEVSVTRRFNLKRLGKIEFLVDVTIAGETFTREF